MTTKLISSLAEHYGLTADECKTRLSVLSNVITGLCADLDSVAIPGFGSFQPVKHEEKLVADATGRRFLVPPCIKVGLKSSVVLRKKFVG